MQNRNAWGASLMTSCTSGAQLRMANTNQMPKLRYGSLDSVARDPSQRISANYKLRNQINLTRLFNLFIRLNRHMGRKRQLFSQTKRGLVDNIMQNICTLCTAKPNSNQINYKCPWHWDFNFGLSWPMGRCV